MSGGDSAGFMTRAPGWAGVRAAFLVLVLLIAGCASPAAPEVDDDPSPPAARVVYAPDCSIASPAPGGWAEPCLALASRNPSPSKTEIDAAVNPLDPRNAIVASKDLDPEASSCVWSVAQVTKDGGRSWTTSYVGGKASERGPGHPLFGWACITDPILAYAPDGTAFYALQAYDLVQPSGLPGGLGSAIYLARSKDGGETWPKVIALHVGDGTAAFHDYMRMAANPKTGSVYTVWNQVSGAASEVVLVATRDGGESAAPPTYVAVPGSPAQARQTGLAAASDGTVHLLAMGGVPTGNDVFLATSTDDARTFSVPAKAFTVQPVASIPNAQYRVGTFVELAVDASGGERDGCLYAVWADGGVGDGDADVLSRASCDAGATWSDEVRVNRDPTASDQFMPRVVVDAHGVVHVAYLTRAYDPENRLVDAEHAYSLDGGATWTTKRLTAVSSDGDLGVHQDGFPFYGDYIGIASAGGRTYAAFPETSTGVAEIAVAALERSG